MSNIVWRVPVLMVGRRYCASDIRVMAANMETKMMRRCGEALETITASCLPKSHYRPPVYRYSTVLDCTALNSLNLCLQSSFMVLIFGSRLKSERLRDHGKEETNAISFELLQTRHQGETFVEPLLICKRLHNALVSAF
ncbi:hypothetical protein Bca52824_036608 [Brassica carinata]|uniref:Uncharacterized protein n=1 Tax=Brassica carinata TaxID=52824 RepID=A0A8X7V3Y2_BRACI|nr:hypothetical protein Bca52824_036608 [Brassica carinata]